MNIRDLCRQAATQPDGVSSRELPGNFSTVSSALWALATRGEIFGATISHKNVRYFDTQARAQAYELANKLIPKFNKPKSGPRRDKNAPMVITAETIFTQCPSPQTIRPWTNTHSRCDVRQQPSCPSVHVLRRQP